MKNIIPFFFSAGLFISSCGPSRVVYQEQPVQQAPPPTTVYQDQRPMQTVSYQSFYDDLSPYGNWINYPGYGYVWMPNAGPDFRPYSTNGNWIYTDAGWTWASDYRWGWAPFHYGRWFYEGGYGWMWLPGNEWAPAWVSWRGGGDYYGWAPLGPNISVDVALNSYNPPMNYWNFVPRRYMGNPGWHDHYVNETRNVTIINNTTIINNYSGSDRSRYSYAPGPDANEVRRVSGSNIQQVQIREANTPGSRVTGNQFSIYRPHVDATPSNRSDAAARPAPARVQSIRDLRPQVQNPGNNNSRPAIQPAVQNPNNNNNSRPGSQPAIQNPDRSNNPRPVTQPQNPNFNNNPRPSTLPVIQNPDYNNNRRPATQNPAYNNSPRPTNSNPNFNRQAATQPVQANPTLATTGRTVDSRFNQRAGNSRPVQQQSLPLPSPANRAQMQVRPATGNQNTPERPIHQAPQTQQQSTRPLPKPADKPEEKPKTRDAN